MAVGSAAREPLVAVVGIHVDGEEELAGVAHAAGALGAFLGAGQRGEQ